MHASVPSLVINSAVTFSIVKKENTICVVSETNSNSVAKLVLLPSPTLDQISCIHGLQWLTKFSNSAIGHMLCYLIIN